MEYFLVLSGDRRKPGYFAIKLIWAIFSLFSLASCSFDEQQDLGQRSPQLDSISLSSVKKTTTVDVALARLTSLSSTKEYVGTTKPSKQVALRSQVEGRLLDLAVDLGDWVNRGQEIGQLDDSLLTAAVSGARAELASLESELARAKIQVKNAQIRLEEAQIQLEQAQNDAARYRELAKTGLIAQQQAESFETAAKIAQKALLSAQEAIKTEEQAVAAAQGRIAVQQAAIAESEQRQVYTKLIAPLTGVVVAKAIEPGSLIQSGEEVITIGDLSQIKVVVPLSELDLGKVTLGQGVKVKLDAFGDRIFTGKVSQIAPTTSDSVARQIAVEITVANPDNQIKGGLLARVNFQTSARAHIVVPESALVNEAGIDYIFIVKIVEGASETRQTTVTKRRVQTGDRSNGKVEVIAGIKAEERYVVRSSNPLGDGEMVALSIISE